MPTAKKSTVSKTTKAKTVTTKSVKAVKKPVVAQKAVPVASKAAVSAMPKTAMHKMISLPVLDTKGKAHGTVDAPEVLFHAKVNAILMAQAVRVYLANQREGSASTKTRGEVNGSTRKIYRQKGTGRARHGGIRAPIFVGGGIAFGPRPKDYSLTLPEKMNVRALASALTQKVQQKQFTIIGGVAKLAPKTKNMVAMLQDAGIQGKVLLLTDGSAEVTKAVRNIPTVTVMPARNVFTYAIIAHKNVICMEEAITLLDQTFAKKLV